MEKPAISVGVLGTSAASALHNAESKFLKIIDHIENDLYTSKIIANFIIGFLLASSLRAFFEITCAVLFFRNNVKEAY